MYKRLTQWLACGALSLLAACGYSLGEHRSADPQLFGVSDFGTVRVGAQQVIHIAMSNGDAGFDTYEPLRSVAISVEGVELTVDRSCESAMLASNVVCPIRVTWAPTAAYALAGRLVVVTDAPNSPTTLALRGVSVP